MYIALAYTYLLSTLKGQCHEIFECCFFCIKLVFLVPLEVPWGDFDFCPKFTEIFEYEIVSAV